MKEFIITRENLKKLGACEEGIKFAEHNGLTNLNFYDLKVEGDFDGNDRKISFGNII